jgi:hypothetical protein
LNLLRLEAGAFDGSADRVRARLRDWQAAAREGKLNTLVLNGATQEALRLAAETVL